MAPLAKRFNQSRRLSPNLKGNGPPNSGRDSSGRFFETVSARRLMIDTNAALARAKAITMALPMPVTPVAIEKFFLVADSLERRGKM